MRVTIDWLREYVDIEESAEEVAEVLTASGTAVEEILEHEGEAVLDLEITTNRPDCLGVIGVARELAAVTGGRSGGRPSRPRSPARRSAPRSPSRSRTSRSAPGTRPGSSGASASARARRGCVGASRRWASGP
jgi:hypothetical protein